jgi:translation initiation factor RLI1
MIINLPKDLEKETTHRYGPNSFKLHRCVRARAWVGWVGGGLRECACVCRGAGRARG